MQAIQTDAAYMKNAEIPSILEILLKKLLRDKPTGRENVLETIKRVCVVELSKEKSKFNDLSGTTTNTQQGEPSTLSDILKQCALGQNSKCQGIVNKFLDTLSTDVFNSGSVQQATQNWCTSKDKTLSLPSPVHPTSRRGTMRKKATGRAPVYKVVFTGGPCAGKSTGMSTMRKRLESSGFNVLVVPEIATLLFEGGGGIAFHDGTDETVEAFQFALLRIQRCLEEEFTKIARACNLPAVICCDRGAMDGKAFCSEETWDKIVAQGGWSQGVLRDSAYDLVIHLVTAADGAPDYYNTDGNASRTETPEAAIAQDVKLQEMWLGHPRHRIIDNSTGFEEKIDRAIAAVLQLIGISHPGPIKKYLMEKPPSLSSITVPYSTALVSINVLRGSFYSHINRLYKRSSGLSTTYTCQSLRRTPDGEIQRIEEGLTERGYNVLLAAADPQYPLETQKIVSFVYEKKRYEMALDQHDEEAPAFLYVETEHTEDGEARDIEIPPFLSKTGDVKDVTGSSADQPMCQRNPGFGHARLSCTSLASDYSQDTLGDLNDTQNWMRPHPHTTSPSEKELPFCSNSPPLHSLQPSNDKRISRVSFSHVAPLPVDRRKSSVVSFYSADSPARSSPRSSPRSRSDSKKVS